MPEEQSPTDSVFTVAGLFAPEEHEEFTRIAENVGFEDALVGTPDEIVRRVWLGSDNGGPQSWYRSRWIPPGRADTVGLPLASPCSRSTP